MSDDLARRPMVAQLFSARRSTVTQRSRQKIALVRMEGSCCIKVRCNTKHIFTVDRTKALDESNVLLGQH